LNSRRISGCPVPHTFVPKAEQFRPSRACYTPEKEAIGGLDAVA